jgi:hypothetical protein
MERRVVVVLALVVAAVGGVAAPTAAGVAQDTTQTSNGTAAPTPTPVPNGTSGSGGSFGAAISSFMQASAAETEGTVDTGMWVAEFARSNASEHRGIVTARGETLERRLDRLEEERTDLLNASDGNVTMEERARASRLTARIDALHDALNRTTAAAEESGVNATRLETLRTRTRGLSGPEVAALAHNLTDDRGPPEDAGRPDDAGLSGDAGPPDDVGPSGDAGPPDDTDPSEDAGPLDDTDPSEDAGPPDDTDPSEDAGPPDDSGPSGDTSNETDAASDGDGDTGNGKGPGRSDDPPGDRRPSSNATGRDSGE